MSLNILKNVSLAKYTSWLIGGEAEFFCLPINIEQLKSAVQYSVQNRLRVTILGGGSNVLISDNGIRGLVICLKRFTEINYEIKEDKIFIKCLAGTSKSELLKVFLKNKLPPALFLAGLPGDVGGGIVMNAGVAEMHEPREFMQLVDSIVVMNLLGETKEIKKSELTVNYRHTDGWQPNIVISAKMSWSNLPDEEIMAKVRSANKMRLLKQPLDMPSCGSVFKNPEGYKVAQLIDSCGLKGFKIGDAQVSLKHANFIVNLNKATAFDTWSVILFVQKTVKEKLNVDIFTEVIRLGEWA